MKKNVLCVFSLILYILLACTVLSWGIKYIMMVRVELSPLNTKATAPKITRSFSGDKMIFSDENGEHVYEVEEDAGWSKGSYAAEVTGWTFSLNAVQIEGSAKAYYVMSASRQPEDGKQVAVVEEFEVTSDQYLALYAEGVVAWLRNVGIQNYGTEFLPENGELAAENDHILLVDMSDVTLPFMERTARNLDAFSEDCMEYATDIFSMVETENFLNMLPWVGCLAALVAFPIFLWIVSCILLRGERRKRGEMAAVAVNGVLSLASLAGILLLLKKIELPSSLLPAGSIFDFDHYIREFSMIRQSLQELGVRQDIVTLIERMPAQSVQIFLIGLELSLTFVLVEWLVVRVLCNRGE